ncbi:type IV pilus twitching motility protein PilT [Quadrisphaera sp. KR29]|uniref:type IV pilus twitching motility protein PilT n=1 Tax=Quadrisphaera sp. KR29 TaxID=3461391 RepID=UPI0040444800
MGSWSGADDDFGVTWSAADDPATPAAPWEPSSLLQDDPLLPPPGAGHPGVPSQLPPSGAHDDARVARTGGAVDEGATLDITAVLLAMLDSGASDLHLTAGAPPTVRLHGGLRPLQGFEVLSGAVLQRSLYGMLTQKQRVRFEEDLELDFAHSVPGRGRFRVNVYRQRESLGAAFRVIPAEIKPLDALGIPPAVAHFAGLPRGLVLVTGPTGSGKSTTLAALVDLANSTRSDHIMTVEDPIEFLHRHKKCLVNQREVGEDTHSFAAALKHVLRQDPDIILVGELRDLETISVALTAAETGHLVFATLHTQDAAQTIDRIVDVFPAEQQEQVRAQLAGAIQGVVCQTLCKTADGKGRAVATEVMIATPAIRNLIREGKTHQIYSAMQAGGAHGMHTLDQHLADLVRRGRVTRAEAADKAHSPEDFARLVRSF